MADNAVIPPGGALALAAIAMTSDHQTMAGPASRRTLRRRRQRADAAARRNVVDRFPPDLLAEIHRYLRLRRADFLQRLAFASVCRASSAHLFGQDTPCLLLPLPVAEGDGGSDDDDKEDDYTKATVFSVADRRAATVRTSDPAMRGQAILGSSCGWLVTADLSGTLRMANPVTGAQVALPAITTGSIPLVKRKEWFHLDPEAFLKIRFAGPPPPDYDGTVRGRTYTFAQEQMRESFYRKVVLSASPRGGGGYAAMLLMERGLGAPAFATAEDPAWRMAPSRDGVEDAIHHDGRFYSVTYSGVVEAWDQRERGDGTAEFTSAVVAPTLPPPSDDETLRRKYLVAGPGGRLMAVLKHAADVEGADRFSRKDTRVWFTVQVLDEARGRWDEAAGIGDAALFVGVNGSVCVPAAEHRGLAPGCVYYTDDEVADACLRHKHRHAYRRSGYQDTDDSELRNVGVYSLMRGKVEEIGSSCLGKNQLIWPVAAWFTPSVV